jgi:hypothetical protein
MGYSQIWRNLAMEDHLPVWLHRKIAPEKQKQKNKIMRGETEKKRERERERERAKDKS